MVVHRWNNIDQSSDVFYVLVGFLCVWLHVSGSDSSFVSFVYVLPLLGEIYSILLCAFNNSDLLYRTLMLCSPVYFKKLQSECSALII